MNKVIITALVCATFVLGACHQNRSTYAPPASSVNYVTHTVRYPGETLSIIASWYTGSSRNWSQILDHNPGLDVRRIRVGNDIQIPDFLIVKDSPMPKSFLDSLTKGGAKSEEMAASTAEEKQAALTDTTSTQPNVTITDSTEERPSDLSETETTTTTTEPTTEATTLNTDDAPSAEEPVTPQEKEKKEIRLKTRDELLKELLDE